MNEQQQIVTTVVENEAAETSSLYTHPNILDQTRDELLFRLTQIRNRRLIAALNFRTAESARIDKHNNKTTTQRDNLIDKTRRDLIATDEKIAKIEKQIHKIMELHNSIRVLDM